MRAINLFFLLLFSISGFAVETPILYPTINSIGFQINLDNTFDTDESSHCIVEYREYDATNQAVWREGFKGDRVKIGNKNQFRGSLFSLDPNTQYEVRLTILDTFPTLYNSGPLYANTTTLNSLQINPTANLKWVTPNGTGSAYTQANPGNLKTLLTTGMATCGTTIYLMEGNPGEVYDNLDIAFNITQNCTEATPIQLIAAPGEQPVIDGGYYDPLTWTQDPSDPNLYSASLPSAASYTNLCMLDGEVLYPYPTLSLTHSGIDTFYLFNKYNLKDLNFNKNGFVRNHNTIWIKTTEGKDPNLSEVILSKSNKFLTIYGNNRNAHLQLEGLTIKNISKSVAYREGISPFYTLTQRVASALDLRNIHHVTISNCDFQYNNTDINFQQNCNNIVVQNCDIKNQYGLWSHAMRKKSRCDPEPYFLGLSECSIYPDHPTAWGRNYERGAILLQDSRTVIIRRNTVDGTNSGVVGANTVSVIEEVDIYDNVFMNHGDAIENDDEWCNLRVWNNEIINSMAAFSIAPPKVGPRYFFRNTIHHMAGRINHTPDPYFAGCNPPSRTKYSAAVGIKTNSGYNTQQSHGDSRLYFFNNTFHTEDDLGFVFTSRDSEWKEATFINNIFYDQTKHVAYFHGLANFPDFQINFKRNNFYSANPSSPILIAKEIHGQYNCIDIENVSDIQNDLRTISGSYSIYCTESFQEDPLFTNTNNGGFELSPSSPSIDQGVVIKGFYDFAGSHPDLGAKETGLVSGYKTNTHENTLMIYPNPTTDQVTIELANQLLRGKLSIYSSIGQELHSEELSGLSQHVVLLDGLSPGLHIIQLKSIDGKSYYNKLMIE